MQQGHWDSDLKRYCFQKISSNEVDIGMRERTKEVIVFVSTELGISPPEVVWVRPSSRSATTAVLGRTAQRWADESHCEFARVPDDIRGGYTPWPEKLRQVWIRSDLAASPDLECVAAHETRHIWQKSKDINVFCDTCRAEGDAYPYAYDVLKRYLAGKGCLTPEIEADIERKRESARSEFFRCWPSGRFEALDTLSRKTR